MLHNRPDDAQGESLFPPALIMPIRDEKKVYTPDTP
jgi:hypothetical protein